MAETETKAAEGATASEDKGSDKKAGGKKPARPLDRTAAALALVTEPVLVARAGAKGLVASTRKAKAEDLFAVNQVGDELVVVTVDGQRFRGPAPK